MSTPNICKLFNTVSSKKSIILYLLDNKLLVNKMFYTRQQFSTLRSATDCIMYSTGNSAPRTQWVQYIKIHWSQSTYQQLSSVKYGKKR